MNGYVHTTYDTIGELRRNLSDRYKDCHAVLKELLQNADDAGASELHIAWIDSVHGAEHSLLKGPQLLIVNNAPFSYQDAYAIHMLGTGSKGHDDTKIGKFGLGLKSIFHLCEAYFYVSDESDDKEKADEKLKEFARTSILNPWYGLRYASWDDFADNDQELLRKLSLHVLPEKTMEYFCLCIPLRKSEHCKVEKDDNPSEWAIEPKYYGDASGGGRVEPPREIFSSSRIQSIRQMLPLMSTLDKVCFWKSDSDKTKKLISLAEVKRCFANRNDDHIDWRDMDSKQYSMAGIIESNNGEKKHQYYVGVQELLSNGKLNGLHKRKDWPWMDAQTEKGRKLEPVAVKQHASVVVMEQKGEGVLRFEHAVFLPLGVSSYVKCTEPGEYDFELLLHGNFFIDAGRLGVDFAPNGEIPTVRQEWNEILYREGTMPLVISALQKYAQKSFTQQEDSDRSVKLRNLTLLLAKSEFWDKNKEQICRDKNWIYCLHSENSKWDAVDRNRPYILLPGNEDSVLTLLSAFPYLKEYTKDGNNGHSVLSFACMPRLTATNSEHLNCNLVEQMFNSAQLSEIIDNKKALDYFCKFCHFVRRDAKDGCLPILIDVIRRLFKEVPLYKLRKQNEQVGEIVRILPSDRVLAIPFNKQLVGESERIFRTLIDQNTNILPVPELFLDRKDSSQPNINTGDTKLLLTALSQLRPAGKQEDEFQSIVGQAIHSILSAWDRDSVCFMDEFGDIPLFYVRDYHNNCRISMSAHQLKDCHSQARLFAGSSKLCKKLHGCLTDCHILFYAYPEIVGLLPEVFDSVPACDVSGCAILLSRKPRLTVDVIPRINLLQEMLKGWQKDDKSSHDELIIRNALRYILHASELDTGQNIPLFYGDDGPSPWVTLVQCILENKGKIWRLISADLADEISGAHAKQLGLLRCGPDSVPDLMRNSSIQAAAFMPVAQDSNCREQIVKEWPGNSLGLLKSLPIFTKVDGGFTAITDQTFIQGNLDKQPPVEVFPDLVLIVDESGIIQTRGLAKQSSQENILLTTLKLQDCQLHWEFILNNIPDNISEELKDALKNSAWLSSSDGNKYSPSVVITRDSLLEHIRRIRDNGNDLVHKEDLHPDLIGHEKWKQIELLTLKGEDLYRSR